MKVVRMKRNNVSLAPSKSPNALGDASMFSEKFMEELGHIFFDDVCD